MSDHSIGAEVLIVISQLTFFVMLFVLMKHVLVDKTGMTRDAARVRRDWVQLLAVYFAMFVLVSIVMIPLETYEFVHFVVTLTFFACATIALVDLRMALTGARRGGGGGGGAATAPLMAKKIFEARPHKIGVNIL